MLSMQTQVNGTRKKSTQLWTIGNTVKVGFLTLMVKERTNFGHSYKLTSMDGTKHYEFTPHQGLNRIN